MTGDCHVQFGERPAGKYRRPTQLDLVVLRREGETDSRLTAKLKKIGSVVNEILPETEIEGLTHKRGMNRKTAHAFQKEFKGIYGQIRDVIVLEATWLGYFEPYTSKKLNSFIGKMMLDHRQETIAEEYGLLPFEVKVIEPIRTLCEKIMSLVRFSYAEHPISDLKKKIRHTYDLHQLLRQEEYATFFHSPAFDKMLLKVGQDDVISFKNNNRWLAFHPKDALIFSDTENTWNELKGVYNGEFKNLVYGTLPNDTPVAETLKKIAKRLSEVDWSIELPDKT